MKVGFTCSTFDLLHPGHIIMLQDCKNVCDHLIIGLQKDPSLDRPNKNKPVQTLEERQIMISAVKYVDEVRLYGTESDLMQMLLDINPDIRIIGSDWKGKEFTGMDLDINIHWHQRDHDWSTSGFRRRIQENKI